MYIIIKGEKLLLHKFVWDYSHPNDPFISNAHRIVRSCGNSKCVQPRHLKKITCGAIAYSKNNVRERINRIVDKEGDCILHSYSGSPNARSKTTIHGKSYSIHTVALWCASEYEFIDEIPRANDAGEPLVIRHLCGKWRCINPTHLTLGTIAENNADTFKHGMALCGAGHKWAKLTETQAREVIIRIKLGEGNAAIARELNVSNKAVSCIRSYKSWTYLWPEDDADAQEKIMNVRKKKQERSKKPWTPEMYASAKKYLWLNSSESTSIASFVDTPCRLWNAGMCNDYGLASVASKTILAHVLSAEIEYGPRPTGMVTRHLCDVKLCINPDHLVYGTPMENAADRTRGGKRWAPMAKIDEALALKIRESIGKGTKKERAARFGVSVAIIVDIDRGKSWKIIDPDSNQLLQAPDAEPSDVGPGQLVDTYRLQRTRQIHDDAEEEV